MADKSVTFTEPVRLSGNVLEISNWSRKPGWDKSGTLNDNSFRGTLEIRNRGGKWLVVNELPVGQYVKGLGEVSEGDPEAKAKTIIVAARTYAAFYLQAANRKFPGEPYDGSDDPAVFQRYLGYGLEKRSPSLSKYADETRDVVITYQGKLIKPWYFNASTGKTRSAKQYCESRGGKKCEDIPFLQSVEDPGTPLKAYNGHGVGISGNGATALANRGWTFEDIIRYFLTGVEVGRVE
jgi:peptidoglycan hydrolase-like amidase